MQKHMVALAQFFCPVLIVLSMSKCPSEIVWSNDPSPQASAYHTSQPPMIMFQWPCGFKIQIDRIWSNNLWAHFLALAFALFLGGAVLASAGRFSGCSEDLGEAFAFGAGFSALQATQQKMKMGVWNLELYHYKIVKVENKHTMGPRSAQHMVQAAILLTAIHEQLTKLLFLLYLVHKSCGVILENNLNRWYLADILKNKYHASFFFPDLLIAKTRMQREQCNDPARTW